MSGKPSPIGSASLPADEPRSGRSAWLIAHRDELAIMRARLRGREWRGSGARLVVFAIGVVGIIRCWPAPRDIAGFAVIATACFAATVAWHRRRRSARLAVERRQQIVAESLQRIAGERVVLRQGAALPAADAAPTIPPRLSDGPRWSLTAQEIDDLDLFAEPVGVFGLLNRTSSVLGRRRLHDALAHPMLSPEHIAHRYAAVRGLARQPALRIGTMAELLPLRSAGAALDALVSAIQTAAPLPPNLPVIVLRVWGILSAAGAVAAIWLWLNAGNSAGGLLLLALFMLNTAVWLPMRRALRRALDPWRGLSRSADACLAAARYAASDLPGDGELGSLRAAFADASKSPALPALCRRLPWADAGGPLHAALNALCFYDLNVAHGILRVVLRHRDALIAALSALADLELLLSLATFADEEAHTCDPVIVADHTVTIDAGRHPLIDPRESVPNDVHLDRRTRGWVLTGSNMSGKSTFLRMVGINVLLAQIGSAAMARSMRLSPVRLITDLRARDDIGRHESYFMAEVRHLHRLVAPPPGDTPVLGLIDEPFRGTNSDEQVAASVAVTCHLLESGNFFLIATHDRQLTRVAERDGGANHHFAEELHANGMVFDYRLRAGPARTRNAIDILEREGYPSAILAAARKHIDGDGHLDRPAPRDA
ncbi:MAG: hypothetical protein L6Q92_13605 [Phycisphaerae bacterium]|nr:hypothetical protein [Phycisphaerae bacterium]